MASSQLNRNVANINADQKAKVDKAIDDAKKFLENNQNENASQHQLAKVAGAIKNNQQRPVTIMRTHSYQGKFLVDPPFAIAGSAAIIDPESTGFFLHEGRTTSHGDLKVIEGSKAAIIYVDSVCGWIVSWYRPDNADEPSKVYADVGPKEMFEHLDWDSIEQRLDGSCGPISQHKDSKTGAQITVTIKDIVDKKAVLAAVFEKP